MPLSEHPVYWLKFEECFTKEDGGKKRKEGEMEGIGNPTNTCSVPKGIRTGFLQNTSQTYYRSASPLGMVTTEVIF
jgi:hypothetical protein